MKDTECVEFLQWALPRLRMRWPGFRRVRKQVCKRISRRMSKLELSNVIDYQSYVETHGEEWPVLEGLCRITISRFYRNKSVFALLEQEILPRLARQALAGGEHILRFWSAGCGAGEEPYSIVLLWDLGLKPLFPDLDMHILATDLDSNVLQRGKDGCYSAGSVKELPEPWRDAAFQKTNGLYRLRPQYKTKVEFLEHDVRTGIPDGPFHLILCRNLVFTYFDRDLQSEIARRMWEHLITGGVFIIGVRETIPNYSKTFKEQGRHLGIYQKHVTDGR
ncbi:MAG: chemotaxis protein CheR [Gammaproteobacteria bacterium]|nr:chemotaxis protein CheR [Gammaproteobacteria bacterium]MCI0591679.1 chemotaxis protein CheR [Gammaproteobacteria bacterium]